MKSAIIALAAIGSTLAAAGTAAPAFAGSANATEKMAVHYSDLNLASADGQKILARRIDQAAKKICRIDQGRTGTRLKSADAGKCYREAKESASKQFAAIIEDKRLGG